MPPQPNQQQFTSQDLPAGPLRQTGEAIEQRQKSANVELIRSRILEGPLSQDRALALQKGLQSGAITARDLFPGADGDPMKALLERGEVSIEQLQEQPSAEHQSVLDFPSSGAVDENFESMAQLTGNTLLGMGEGAAEGTAGIFSGLEGAGQGISNLAGAQFGTQTPPDAFEQGVASGFFKQMAQSLQQNRIQFGDDAGLLLRSVDRGSEIFGAGLPFGAGFVGLGQSMISRLGGQLKPQHIQQLRQTLMGKIKLGIIDLAQNPGKMAAYDAMLSTGAGYFGELAEDRGANQLTQGLAELSGIVGLSIAGSMARGTIRFMGGVTTQSRAQAEERWQMALAMLFDDDTLRRLESGEETVETLAAMAGGRDLNISVGQLTRNASLIAAERAVGFDPTHMSTANRSILFDVVQRIRKSVGATEDELLLTQGSGRTKTTFKNQEAQNKFTGRLEMLVANEVHDLEKVKQKTLSDLEEALNGVADPQLREQIGGRAFAKIAQVRSLANKMIQSKYQMLQDMPVPPAQMAPLKTAISRIFSKSFNRQVDPSVIDIIEDIEGTFKFQRVENIPPGQRELKQFDPVLGRQEPKATKKLADLSGNRLSRLNDIQTKIGDEISSAFNDSNKSKLRQLNILQSGVNRIWDNLADASVDQLGARNIGLLKAARKSRREFATLFQDFEVGALFTKTSQGQLKTAPEDVLANFVKPSGKRMIERANQFKKAFGDNPEALDIIQDELMRRLLAKHRGGAKGGSSELIPAKVKAFKSQYDEVIRAYGLQDRWKGFSQVVSELEVRMGWLDRKSKSFEKSALKQYFIDRNVTDSLPKLMKNQREFAQVHQDIVRRGDPELLTFWRRSVAENITNELMQPSLNVMDGGVPFFNAQSTEAILQSNRPVLDKIIGKETTNDLVELVRGVQFVEDAGRGASGVAQLGAELENIKLPAVSMVLSLVRQINQRVLSPQFVATNLTVNALEHMRSKVMREVFTELLSDPKKMSEFVRLGRKKALRPLYKGLFRRAFGVEALRQGESQQQENLNVSASGELSVDPQSVQRVSRNLQANQEFQQEIGANPRGVIAQSEEDFKKLLRGRPNPE